MIIINKELTLENKCELNAIRNEIEKMPALAASDKVYALNQILCDILDLYDADSIIGSARYTLEIYRKINEGRNL